MAAEVGSPAPGFTLTSHRGETVSLDDLRGHPVVLHFFPEAFSDVCTRQFTGIGAGTAPYAGEDARLLAVSVDAPDTLAGFAAATGAGHVDFLSDADPRGAVSEAYGIYIPERGHAGRATFVIDAQGVVRHAARVPIPLEIPDEAAVRTALAGG